MSALDPSPVAAAIEADLRRALQPDSIELRDDSHRHAGHAGAREGGHFSVRIVAGCFAGRNRVARHRLPYNAPCQPQESPSSADPMSARVPC